MHRPPASPVQPLERLEVQSHVCVLEKQSAPCALGRMCIWIDYFGGISPVRVSGRMFVFHLWASHFFQIPCPIYYFLGCFYFLAI